MALQYAAAETRDLTKGLREDLSDLIHMLSPTETPFLMMAGRGTAENTKVEWQMDSLAAQAQNAQLEGDAPGDASTFIPTIRVANYTQISTKEISVTGTAEVVNKAGRTSSLSYTLAKRAKELKRDIEHTNVGQTSDASDSSTRVSAGVANFAHTHLDGRAVGVSTESGGTHVDYDTSDGVLGGWLAASAIFKLYTDGTSPRNLTETMLKGVIQGAWHNGGDPTVIMTNPTHKVTISGMTGNSTRFDRGEDKRLVASIDVYASDFGEHRVIPNRFQIDDMVFAFTPELWEVCYLRPFRQHALAKTGDAENRQLLAEWSLKGLNQTGNGFIFDLN